MFTVQMSIVVLALVPIIFFERRIVEHETDFDPDLNFRGVAIGEPGYPRMRRDGCGRDRKATTEQASLHELKRI